MAYPYDEKPALTFQQFNDLRSDFVFTENPLETNIEELWLGFLDHVKPKASPETIAEMRRVFYAGAAGIFTLMVKTRFSLLLVDSINRELATYLANEI